MPVALFESSYGANWDRIVISFRGVAPQLQLHSRCTRQTVAAFGDPRQLTDPAWVLGKPHVTGKRRSVAPANRNYG